MFIEYLNKEEKEVFFSLALDLVRVDDAFSLDEKEKIKQLSLRILGEEGHDVEHLYNDLSTLENLSKKKIVLMESVGLCYVDGDYCESEKKFIHEVAGKMEVDNVTLKDIENWALGLVNHMNKGIELINK